MLIFPPNYEQSGRPIATDSQLDGSQVSIPQVIQSHNQVSLTSFLFPTAHNNTS